MAACPGPVVVAALAGAPGREYDVATANGVRHYRDAGAEDVRGAPDARSDPQAAVAALRAARLLVLPGGSPARLLAALQDGPLGGLVAELLADDGTVMGSSAGAMVLGGWTVLPERGPQVAAGLGVVPQVLVVPHWSGGRGDWLRAVEAVVPAGTAVLGIPEESGVVVRDGLAHRGRDRRDPLAARTPRPAARAGADLGGPGVSRTAPLSDGPLPALAGAPAALAGGRTAAAPGCAPVRGRAASPRCSCTASAARRSTGPTWWRCWPAGCRPRCWTCPGSAAVPPPVDGRYRLATHVRAVVRAVQERGDGPVHLFGNSLGGAVATLVAAYRPDLVRTLTLVSPALPSLRPKQGSDPRLPLLLLPGVDALARRRIAAATPEQRARAVMQLCFADPSRVSAERLAEAAEEVRRRSALEHESEAFSRSLRGLVGSYLTPGPRSVWRQAGRVQAPTLLVWGDRDRLVDVSLAPRAARDLPRRPPAGAPGVGHVAQIEAPEPVARAFAALQDEVAERRRPRRAAG